MLVFCGFFSGIAVSIAAKWPGWAQDKNVDGERNITHQLVYIYTLCLCIHMLENLRPSVSKSGHINK